MVLGCGGLGVDAEAVSSASGLRSGGSGAPAVGGVGEELSVGVGGVVGEEVSVGFEGGEGGVEGFGWGGFVVDGADDDPEGEGGDEGGEGDGEEGGGVAHSWESRARQWGVVYPWEDTKRPLTVW